MTVEIALTVIQTGVLVEIARRQGAASAERSQNSENIEVHGDRLDRHADRLDRHADSLAEVDA